MFIVHEVKFLFLFYESKQSMAKLLQALILFNILLLLYEYIINNQMNRIKLF